MNHIVLLVLFVLFLGAAGILNYTNQIRAAIALDIAATAILGYIVFF